MDLNAVICKDGRQIELVQPSIEWRKIVLQVSKIRVLVVMIDQSQRLGTDTKAVNKPQMCYWNIKYYKSKEQFCFCVSLQGRCHLFSNTSTWTFVTEFLTGKHRGKNSDTNPKQREGNAAGDEKCEKYTGLLVLERRIEIRDHNAKYFHNLVTCLLLGRTPIN